MNKGYIYKTTNLINNRVYIGKHLGRFDSNYFGSGKIIKNAINKYGKSKFKLNIIIYSDNEYKLNELEKFYIAKYRKLFGRTLLYNISDGGGGCTGYKHSKKIRNILKQRQTGKKCPWLCGDKNPAKRPEVKEKNRLAHLGKKHSLKTKKKMSQSHKGKKRSIRTAEHCKNLSISLIGRKAWSKGLNKEIDIRLSTCGNRINHTARAKNEFKKENWINKIL